ncbi:MAG: hypothetical protein IEMM0002_1061 [bacterium]|nr:MAG: hypothetical protein IEMM0002_1061 [bacterium]
MGTNLIDWLDPLKRFTESEYAAFWQTLFDTVLNGFWAKLIAAAFLLLSFWFGVRRQNFATGLVFFLIAMAFTYSAGIFQFLFRGSP